MARNLLICRAGPGSLHPAWLTSARDFDLALSCYGEVPERYREGAAYYEHVPGFKFPPLASLLEREWSFVSGYEYVGFPDDDLAATSLSWNRLFALGREFGFHLFQPALAPGSFFNWQWVLQDRSCRARVVRAVEVMTPIFRIDVLEQLRETFSLNQSGWGIDGVWAARLPHPQYRLGVIDEMPVLHTRPAAAGSLYRDFGRAGVKPGADYDHLLRQRMAVRGEQYVLYERILPPQPA